VPVIEWGESTLYYESYGTGRPLVFLHGMAGNTLVWWQQVAFLEERYRCILVDQRGWGRSTGPLPEPWTDAFVPNLEAVLEELGVEEFAVVAQSMGGWTVDAFCRPRWTAGPWRCSLNSQSTVVVFVTAMDS